MLICVFAMEMGSALLSPEDIARHCGLSRKAVYRAIDRGELKAFRLCSRLRIDPAAVEEWLAASAVRQDPRDSNPTLPSRRLPGSAGLRRFLTDP
jgi:excisionase family DNA binding protein